MRKVLLVLSSTIAFRPNGTNFKTFWHTAPATICAKPAEMTARIKTGVVGNAPIAAE